MKRRRLTSFIAAVVLGLGGLLSAARATPPDQQGQRHIVVLKESAGDPGAVAAEHARRHDAEVLYVYRDALRGYAASFRGGGFSDVARDSRVAYVEPDREVKAVTRQTGATWGLDRIDQRS